METDVISALPNPCGFTCQFEYLEISSSFFSVSVYTPALIVTLVGILVYRKVRRFKSK